MDSRSVTSHLNFLSGGGEMGELMRAKDWSKTLVGKPETWPQSLRTSLSIILNSRFPMFIFWGPDLICFYNDAYRPSLGKSGKHPDILGEKAAIYWAEIWHIIKPLIDQVLSGGDATWSEDQLIPIFRNGTLEDVYWTFSYSAVNDESGSPAGVFITCVETTEKVKNLQQIEIARNLFKATVVQAPVGITILKGQDMFVEMANIAYLQMVDKKESEFVGRSLYSSLPEVKEYIKPILDNILETGIAFKGNEFEVPLNRLGRTELSYFNFVYQPLREADGSISGIMVVATEVTDLALAKQKSTDTEEKLQIILNASELGTWEWILKTDTINYSNRYLQVFGYVGENISVTHEDLLKKLHPEDIELRNQAIKDAMENGSLYYTARIIWDDQSIHWIEAVGKMFYDESGQPLKLLGTVRDITEQKMYSQKIAENENRLRIAALSSELGTWEYNPVTEVLTWDEATKKLFDSTFDTAVTLELFWSKIHPGERDIILQKMLKALDPAIADTYDAEYRVLINGGNDIRWIHAKGKALFDENNQPYLFSGTVLDITEKRIALEELKENEERFRFLANAMPQFVWTSGEDGQLNYFNEAVYNYSGMSHEQVVKDGWIKIVHPEDTEENISKWLYSVQTGEPFLFEHRFRRHDGQYRWQLSRAIPQKDEHGKIQMWVGTSTDIDDIKKHEEEKNDFIKMANHELKTPVTTIKGYVQLLLKTHGKSTDTALVNSLAIVDRQVTKLSSLISDLLDLTKIETGKLPLNNEVFSIANLVKDTVKDMQPSAQSHFLELNLHDDALVFGDKDRISQVLFNLFNNALKYSPKANKIIIQVNKDAGNIVISVTDFGIGIAKEDQDKIFERFYRVSGKDEKTFPGFGIGLFIVKEIVERHHGKLWLSSQKNEGSTFYFSLPIHK